MKVSFIARENTTNSRPMWPDGNKITIIISHQLHYELKH
jgi:hypothetical protein